MNKRTEAAMRAIADEAVAAYARKQALAFVDAMSAGRQDFIDASRKRADLAAAPDRIEAAIKPEIHIHNPVPDRDRGSDRDPTSPRYKQAPLPAVTIPVRYATPIIGGLIAAHPFWTHKELIDEARAILADLSKAAD